MRAVEVISHDGLLRVTVKLSPEPPDDWCDRLSRGVGVPISPDMHRISAHRDTAYLTTPDDELERYVEHLDQRIEATNHWYETEIVPAIQASEDEAERKAKETDRRLADARRRAKDL